MLNSVYSCAAAYAVYAAIARGTPGRVVVPWAHSPIWSRQDPILMVLMCYFRLDSIPKQAGAVRGAVGRARCTTPQFGPLGGPASRPERANFEATVRGRKVRLQKRPLQSWIALMTHTSAMQEMELVARSHHVGSSRFYPLVGCARRGRRPY